MRPSLLIATTLLPTAALADDEPLTHTAAEVAGAPHAGAESGRTDAGDGDGESPVRVAARGALFIPKLAFEVATSPVHGALWVGDRYHLGGETEQPAKISIAPTADFESGFGGTLGARFIDRDVLGGHEAALLSATLGSRYRARVLGALDSGDRLGAIHLGIDAGYQRVPDLPFYGVGNSSGAETDLFVEESRAAAHADLPITAALHATASTTVSRVTARDAALAAPMLAGLGRAIDEVEPSLELRWDDRRATSLWVPKSMRAGGSLARVFAGRAVELDAGAADHWHYGGELQHYWQLDSSARVLSARLYAEGVSGKSDAVPLVDLPALGGDAYLRGYGYDRFRDRLAGFGEVQYRWDLSSYTDVYLYVDAGRVYHDAGELGVDHLRVGYGLGLALLGGRGDFIAEGTIGSSIDGGIVAALSFNPIEDRRRSFR